MNVTTGDNLMLTLDTTVLLGEGGEGRIYKIRSPRYFSNMCVKLYNCEQKAKEMRSKIEYMIWHTPPVSPSYVRLCWPVQTVFDQGRFVGFVMPMAFEGSQNLYRLIPMNFKHRKVLPDSFKIRFDRQKLQGIRERMKLAIHLSAAFYTLTSTGGFCIIDLKPDNILVTQKLEVSIVDCDSFQVVEKGKLLYESNMCTPAYAPPESYRSLTQQKSLSWDYFGYAVLVYELLFGVHPFSGTFREPYDNVTDLAGKIKAGLFVHGLKSTYLQPLKPSHPHLLFKKLPEELQSLWIRTFDIGLHQPSYRTTFEEFGRIFYRYIA